MTLEVLKQLINMEFERAENMHILRQNIIKLIELFIESNKTQQSCKTKSSSL
jgi:hypothetical protein